jgi:ParB/RepB/Spo0J family partition protein
VSNSQRNKLMAGLQKRERSILADPHLNRIGQSVRKNRNPLSKEKLYSIEVSQIVENPFQYRTEESLNQSDLKSLATSIKKHGLRTPIQLRRVGEELQLVAGWRRLTAIKKFLTEMTTVTAIVDEEMDDKTHRQLTIIENEQRSDFTVFEKAKAYEDMRKMDGLTLDEIANFVGSSKSRVSRIVKLLKLPVKVINELRVAVLNGLSNGHCDEIVVGFTKRIDSGLTKDDCASWVSEMVVAVLEHKVTIEDIRSKNRELSKPSKTKKKNSPNKKWVIAGEQWKRFEVTPEKEVSLKFQLPEGVNYDDSDAVINYIRAELFGEN